MKNIKNVKTGAIVRVTTQKADTLVNNGAWRFASNAERRAQQASKKEKAEPGVSKKKQNAEKQKAAAQERREAKADA